MKNILSIILFLHAFTIPVSIAEQFNINIAGTGDPSVYFTTVGKASVELSPTQSAGAPGWESTNWQNISADHPFTQSTPATTITSDSGSTATIQILQHRNFGAFHWSKLRDDNDTVDLPNAILIDGHSNSTEWDGWNDSGEPFPARTADLRLTNIPFESYDLIVYLGNQQAGFNNGRGTIRINNQIPTNPSDKSGGTQFVLSTTEPTGTLNEITSTGDSGNYIVYPNLSGASLRIQTWGENFNHLGVAGLQLRKIADAPPETITNWSLEPGASASQSSTGWNGVASKAIDGNTDGVYWNGSVTHTQITSNSWWQVNLGQDRPIDEIVLHNRTDCCAERLSNYRISILNNSGNVIQAIDLHTDSGQSGLTETWQLPSTVIGRTVRIETLGRNRAGNEVVTLAEVEVFGNPGNESDPEVSPTLSTLVQDTNSIPADGSSIAQITVTINDTNGNPMPNTPVLLQKVEGAGAPNITPPSTNTDLNGQATFSVSSDTPGLARFAATSSNIAITQTLNLEFTSPPPVSGEFLNINIAGTGDPGTFFTPAGKSSVELTPNQSAGAPGWLSNKWQNITFGHPFEKSTPPTLITGTNGSTATFQILNHRNFGAYRWNALRDDSDTVNLPNAILLDGHSNSTEWDGFNGSGEPFPFQAADFRLTNIPFNSYDLIVYLSTQFPNTATGRGVIRINNQIPSNASDKSGGIQFILPTSEPTGTLDEITSSGDSGNFVVYNNLSGPNLRIQTWGEDFNHLGVSGIQIRQKSSGSVGPVSALASTVSATTSSVIADGTSTSTVTVTLKDSNGNLLSGKDVTLIKTGGPGIANISPSNAITNNSGQATFTISSSSVGNLQFSAQSDNTTITQNITLTFTAPITSNDIFSVNIYGFWSGTPNQTIVNSVTMSPEQTAGAQPWETDSWNNVNTASPNATITSVDGRTANFQILRYRNPGTYAGQRPNNLLNNGNATILDGHLNTTEDPGDDSNHGLIRVSNIPFTAYDVIVYFGQNQGQRFDGRGSITINGTIQKDYTLITSAPDGNLTRITDPFSPGNYMVFPGLSGANLEIITAGENFTHNGPAAIQIAEAAQARKPIEVTNNFYNPQTDEFTITWNSVPGDSYSLAYSCDLQTFIPFGNPVIPANSSGFSTTYGPFPNPAPGSSCSFIQVREADFIDPEIVRSFGTNNTVQIEFTEPIFLPTASITGNYTLTGPSGQTIGISAAIQGPNDRTIKLNTSSNLAPNSTYTLSTSNITDLAGRPLAGNTSSTFKTFDNNPNGVKVYILAGQSNMVGFGETTAGSRGNLLELVNTQPTKYGSLRSGNSWTSRNDVKVWWRKNELNQNRQVIKGNLNPTFGSDTARFGPEYAFGQVIGDHHSAPVLIVKTAWGGKSLNYDFRPPSAVGKRGGDIGIHYHAIFESLHEVLDNFNQEFPEWAGLGYSIEGFAWHQGFNDSLETFTASAYKDNIADFIRDIRTEIGKPQLPFSLATTGHGGFTNNSRFMTLNENQLSIADPTQFPEFSGNVTSTDTRPFWRAANISPNNALHHWNHHAETFYEIGEALGNGIKSMVNP